MMVGKNNRFLKNSQNGQKYQRFSLRKLSIGVVSVAIAAGFYFDNLTSVQADMVTSGSNQAVVANQGSQTNVNSQSVVLDSAAQTAESTTLAQSSAPASTAATSTSSQESTAQQTINLTTVSQSSAPANTANGESSRESMKPKVPTITESIYRSSERLKPDQAHSVTLHMYTYGNESNKATISAAKSQVVGIEGWFEVTKEQLENKEIDSVTIGKIIQQRNQKDWPNIPVLVRANPKVILNGQSQVIGTLTFVSEAGNITLKLQNINHELKTDQPLHFNIPVAFDLNHAPGVNEYVGTSWGKSHSQLVSFLLDGGSSTPLYSLTIKEPVFNRYNPHKLLDTPGSGDDEVFTVHGNYVGSMNDFLKNPLNGQPAKISSGNYQWEGTIKELADCKK